MKIRYYGPFAIPTGYAQAAHDYMMALLRADAHLEIVSLNQVTMENAYVLDQRYKELLDRMIGHAWAGPEDVRIVHTVPRLAHKFITGKYTPNQNTKTICITTWETSYLPMEIAETLCKFDKVIVPSNWCKDVMGAKSEALKEKMVVVPHTFDPQAWPAEDKTEKDQPYTFLSVLGWSERKNPIGLIKAYWSEFSPRQDVLLKILTPSYSHEDMEALASKIGLKPLSPVQFITERQTHAQLLDLYQTSHCFVSATRGEAWNLPAFEAAVMGLPIIIGPGGHDHFLRHYAGRYCVQAQLTPAVPQTEIAESFDVAGVRLKQVKEAAPSGITAHQYWYEPDLFLLRVFMRGAMDHRPKDFGDRKHFDKLYGYETVGPQLLREIERV